MSYRVTHDPTDPEFPHGTNAGWYRNCTCEPCDRAHARLDKVRLMARSRGHRWTHDTPKVGEHIRQLNEVHGFTFAAIARAAKTGGDTVAQIARGNTTWVRRDVGARILATTPEQIGALPGVTVPARRSIQMVNSLMALGWTGVWIAQQLGLANPERDGVRRLRASNRINAGTARKVSELVHRVGHMQGPSRNTAKHAAKQGWYPPAAYNDDGDLDQDAFEVDPEQLRAELGMEILRRSLLKQGIERIAHDTGASIDTVRHYKVGAGIQLARKGGAADFKDPDRVPVVTDVLYGYEWEGWTAAQALAKLELTVHAEPKRGPKAKGTAA